MVAAWLHANQQISNPPDDQSAMSLARMRQTYLLELRLPGMTANSLKANHSFFYQQVRLALTLQRSDRS
jgi:hypothetical protein